MLRAVGFWIRGLADDEFPAPQETSKTWSDSDRTQVAAYLDRGAIHERYRGFSWCRFLCGVDYGGMGAFELTDGKWLWPQGLSHYIRKHDINLPDEFLNDALNPQSHGLPREPLPEGRSKVDYSFWIDWSSQRRNATFLAALHVARAKAEISRTEALQSYCKRLRDSRGESSIKCIWVNCERSALVGMVLCAEHSVSDSDQWKFSSVGHPFFHALLQGQPIG